MGLRVTLDMSLSEAAFDPVPALHMCEHNVGVVPWLVWADPIPGFTGRRERERERELRSCEGA